LGQVTEPTISVAKVQRSATTATKNLLMSCPKWGAHFSATKVEHSATAVARSLSWECSAAQWQRQKSL